MPKPIDLFAIPLGKTRGSRYIATRACRPSASARLRALHGKTANRGSSSFWTSCGVDLEGGEGGFVFSLRTNGFRRFRKSILSETAGAGWRLKAKACTDGEDRFGAKCPAIGSNLDDPAWVTSTF